MTNKLNDENLEKVNGGTPYIGTTPPTVGNFAYKPGEQIYNKVYDTEYAQNFWVRFNVVALGAKLVTTKGFIRSYDLFYKLETADRTISKYDGWYDYEIYKTINFETDIRLKRVSGDGLIIIAGN